MIYHDTVWLCLSLLELAQHRIAPPWLDTDTYRLLLITKILTEKERAQLKTIGALPKWYPRSGPCSRGKRGVERRSDRLADEYRKPQDTVAGGTIELSIPGGQPRHALSSGNSCWLSAEGKGACKREVGFQSGEGSHSCWDEKADQHGSSQGILSLSLGQSVQGGGGQE